MSNNSGFPILNLLAWALGIYFIALGIHEIMLWSSDGAQFSRNLTSFFGGETSPKALVFAVLEIISGAILLITPFNLLKQGAGDILLLAVFLVVAIRAVFDLGIDRKPFAPELWTWLRDLGQWLVFSLGVWSIRSRQR